MTVTVHFCSELNIYRIRATDGRETVKTGSELADRGWGRIAAAAARADQTVVLPDRKDPTCAS